MQLRVVIGQLGLGWGGAPPRRGAVAILSIEWRPSSYIYQGNVGHPGVKWSAPKAEERGETPNQHSTVHQPATNNKFHRIRPVVQTGFQFRQYT